MRTVLVNILFDLDLIVFFLVKASPKPLDAATLNFASNW